MQSEVLVATECRNARHSRPCTPTCRVCRASLFTLWLGYLLALPAAFAQSATARETGAVTGKLMSEGLHTIGEEGIAVATVRIPAVAQSASLEADGTFSFEAVPVGTHVLVLSLPSVGQASESVTVTAGETTHVELEIDHVEHFDEIVVTATGALRRESELSNPVSVLSGADLQLRMGPTLGETLADEPGVASTAFVPGAARPIIRGLSGPRIRVLTNGLDSGDTSAISDDHSVTAEPALAEQIEILKGPAALRYASGAIGGAVNVIDGRIPTARAAVPVSGSVDLAGGSVADERMGSLQLGGGSGEWAWTIAAVSRETDPYEIPGYATLEEDHDDHDDHDDDHDDHGDDHDDHGDDHDDHGDDHEENSFGVVPNTDLSTESGHFGVTRFFGDRGFLGVSVSGFNTEYGLPPGAHAHEHHDHGDEHDDHGDDHDDHDDDHDDDHEGEEEHGHGDEEGPVRLDFKQQRVDLRGDVRLDGAAFEKLEVRLAGTDYEHIELENDEVHLLFENDIFETRVEMFQRQRGASRGSVGVQFTDHSLAATGDEAFVPPTDSTRWELFSSQEIDRGDLIWQFGGRLEQTDHEAADGGEWSGDGLSVAAGFVWQASDPWSVHVSASRSTRMPVARELFAYGLHIPTQTFDIGNRDLDTEVGTGLDLSLRKSEGRVRGEVTVFRQNFQDFIYQAFTGEEMEGAPVLLYSQADTTLTGAEFRGRVSLAAWNENRVHLELSGDTVDAELDAGGNLPLIPPMSLGVGVDYHGHAWRSAIEWRWVDDQTDVAQEETPTDGYTLLNAHVGRRFVFRGQILDLLLRGRNLTDEDARVHTSLVKNFAPLQGRDISLSARFWF